ncbi:MAG: hypothetical protein A2Y62_14345 [Candidatus Fischerbacteria bacterium RBG_13_37_8]|uniref:Nitroreductase domain-containing protein n=1 Tax=Candidatus Fischerbacteria bacterium RBG_13_37_8 TaxID=1817863 RepID=A0A1F5VNR5_9BACT|nr:MAG: hypothetical protein A2Y62_14345 [Candidatus Fischerbacteria bacterium RBG_13_37_8]
MQIEELLQIIKQRRSIREFTDEPVSDNDIKTLIDAARYAPSNTNRQPWKFIIIRNKTILSQISEVVTSRFAAFSTMTEDNELRIILKDYEHYLTFFATAPVVICALYKGGSIFLNQVCKKMEQKDASCLISAELMSASMAIQNLLLAAHCMGLGACCITAPLSIANEEIKKLLNVNPPFDIAALITIGKSKNTPEPTSRKSIALITEIIE